MEEGRQTYIKTECARYDLGFPYFREPPEIGHFSLDEQRAFHKDDHTLLQWIMMNKNRFVIKNNPSTLKRMHDATSHTSNPSNGGLSESGFNEHTRRFESLSTDFVCWRGLLTKLMCIPYENRDDLMLAVIKYRGTYFMCEFDTEQRIRQKEDETPRQKEMCAWGFKFEQYFTADESS